MALSFDVYQPDKYDWSKSSSDSGSKSTSYSGLMGNYGQQLMDSVLPDLTNRLKNYDSDIDTWKQGVTQNLKDVTRNSVQNPMNTEMERLNSLNMLNSSVLGDSLKKIASGVSSSAGEQLTGIENTALEQKNNLTSLLSELVKLGQISQGTSDSTSSSRSETRNEGQPVSRVADMIASMF